MDKPKVLSGYDIVARGVTKLDVSLPEIGLKDVIPNGSWLEQKQIQSAIEGRKHLIEVERIQKLGTLSQAIWHNELKLAEVTHKSGGHWQYLGHNVGKTLYLKPEEALFLMEVNCLLLKHNDLVVSLQKAYSLLLNETNITQYRVYASLSRIGYKILRHKIPKESIAQKCPNKLNETSNYPENIDTQITTTIKNNVAQENNQDAKLFVLDNTSNKNNASDINTENVSLSLSNTLDDCTDINQNQSIKENSKNVELTYKMNKETETKTTCVTNSDNSKTIGYIHGKEAVSDTNKSDIVDNIESSSNQNLELIKVQYNASQDVEAKNEMKTHLKSTNETNIEMEVDVQCVKDETLDTDNSQSNKTSKCDQDIIKYESKCEIIINNPSNIDGSNISKNQTNITDKSTTKDDACACVVGIESVNVTTEMQSFDLSNKSLAGFDRADDNYLAIEVDSVNTDVEMDLVTPKSLDDSNRNITTAINQDKLSNVSNLSNVFVSRKEQTFLNYVSKLKKLTSRQSKPSDYKTIAKHFDDIPELFKKDIVTINVPDQQYLPRNVYVNNTSYVLNLKEIREKIVRCVSADSPVYNSAEDVRSNLRRISNNSRAEFSQSLNFVNNVRFPARQPFYFRPFNFYRPQNNLNYVTFNMFFQRACLPNMYIHPRPQYQPRANPFVRSFSHAPPNTNSSISTTNDNTRKRLRSARITHLNSIKNLAVRLKQLIMSGNTQLQNIESLQRLLFAFNNRYKARLRLTEQFEIVNDENIIETIELDEDVESKRKKPRLSPDKDNFDENFNKLRQVALKLKDLDAKNKCTPKHKRALSKAIKTFNKYYDADIYMNKDYEVIDKRFINIASDSEPECVETKTKVVKRKKLKNPFYILKQRSEKLAQSVPSTSRVNVTPNRLESVVNSKYNEHISNTFSENWLPKETDFGRAEVVKKSETIPRFIDFINDEYLYNFISNHYDDFDNWLEAKIAYLQHNEETDAMQNQNAEIPVIKEPIDNSGLRPLIDAENSSSMTSALEKLRIIRNNNVIENGASLSIDFDVYNRDVPNFRKTNPPKPHFRIICMEESSNFPSAAEVMSLHSKYQDSVAIVFAVVGTSSISYLQINPIDLPVYFTSSDLE